MRRTAFAILSSAVVCLGGFALVGCQVDQAKEVATYRAVLDADMPPTHSFEPGENLSLERALQLANEHNERLGLAGEDYLQALINKKRAAAGFLPTIALTPIYSIQEKTSDGGSGGPSGGGGSGGGSTDNTRLDVPLNTQLNLFNGFRDLNDVRAASRTAEQFRALLLDTQATVLLDVARVYYQILRAERSVDVIRNSLTVQEERLRDTRARLRAGFGKPLDVAQTEAQSAGTRVALIAAMNEVENGRVVLAFLTGAPVRQSPLTDDAALPEFIPGLTQLRETAFNSRQDLAARLAAIQAARFNVRSAFGQYYPSISLDLDVFLSRDTAPTDRDWTAAIVANLPIFSAGLIEADVRTAWSEFRQAKYNESLTRRQIAQDVEIAHQNLLRSAERLTELQVQITAAEEALRQAEAVYRVGSGTNLDRLTAQEALLSAQLDQTTERFNQKLSYLNLLRATGQLSTRLPGEPQPATMPATMPATSPATALSP